VKHASWFSTVHVHTSFVKTNPVHPGENYMEREGGWLEETSK